jgi:hypothetical protein
MGEEKYEGSNEENQEKRRKERSSTIEEVERG